VFTGIVEELGEVVGLAPRGDCAVLRVRTTVVAQGAACGASIAVNGVCLTVVHLDGATPPVLTFDVMAETLQRSVIGALRPGDPVNLERPVPVSGRLDGHIVQGHVDGTGSILSRRPGDAWESVRCSVPPELSRYLAEKGSIAIDGVSLTVTAVGADWFEVGLIPQTLRVTTLGRKRPGDPVNLEVDVIAKYTERLLAAGSRR
jgi:riboflavin synthase